MRDLSKANDFLEPIKKLDLECRIKLRGEKE